MIKFVNVIKNYNGQTPALNGINLQINQGEFISLVGLSGAGKTTLLKLIIGEEQIDGGKILIDDVDIARAGGNLGDIALDAEISLLHMNERT